MKLNSPITVRITQGSGNVFEGQFDTLPITIGRSSKNNICLKDFPWLSRQQAVLNFNGDEYELVDLTEGNKLYFENQPTSRCVVSPRANISIGDLRFIFILPENEKIEQGKTDSGEVTETLTRPHLSHPVAHPVTPTAPASLTSEDRLNLGQQAIQDKANGPAKSWRAAGHPESEGTETLSPRAEFKPTALVHGLQAHYQGARVDLRETRAPRVLEVFVTWKGKILEIQEFAVNERVRIGPSAHASLRIPTLSKDIIIARFNGTSSRCLIPNGMRMRVRRGDQLLPKEEIEKATTTSNSGYIYALGGQDCLSLDLGHDVAIHVRYAPAPRQLTKAKLVEPDEEIRRTFLGSGIVHLFFSIIAIFSAPKDGDRKPIVVQDRVARLVVPEEKKPEPTPTPTPKPTPPPVEKIVKVEPKPEKPKPKRKVQPKPKQVVVRQLKKPIPEPNVETPEKEVDIKNVAALAALGALGPPTENPSNQPVAINISPNAGGMQASPSGIIGAIKAPGGKLTAAGMAGVRTKGMGYGTGTGYGVQGVKGTAGGRAVAGRVVGSPKLVKISREEGLDQKTVMGVVQKYLDEIQRCYERALLSNPDLAGRVEYEWYITPAGSVQWANVKKTDISDGDALNTCVKGVFKKMQFPRARNGMATTPNIGFPFGRL